MIARVWFGRTPAVKAKAYIEFTKKTGLKHLNETHGNRGALMLKGLNQNVTEFYVISFWDSVDSIKQFAGEDINKAVYYPEAAEYLLEMEPELKHYEVPAAIGFIWQSEQVAT